MQLRGALPLAQTSRPYNPSAPFQPRPRPECLHGYWELDGDAKAPTIFPQPLVMASTFDRELVRRVFDAVSTEMRAKSNDQVKQTGEAT